MQMWQWGYGGSSIEKEEYLLRMNIAGMSPNKNKYILCFLVEIVMLKSN